MKIKITYESEADLMEALNHPLQYYIDQGAKLNKSERHPPFRHAYLNIKNPAKPCNSKDSA